MSLSKKENYTMELEKNLAELKEINSRQHDEIKLLSERLTNEARRLKMLEREDDRLRSEISLLESKVCVFQGKSTCDIFTIVYYSHASKVCFKENHTCPTTFGDSCYLHHCLLFPCF